VVEIIGLGQGEAMEALEHKSNGGSNKHEVEIAKEFAGAAYLIDVDDLRRTVQELGEKLANADQINRKVYDICAALDSAGAAPETIEAALSAQFGKPKTIRRRKAQPQEAIDPSPMQMRVLSVLTSEPMRRRTVYELAEIEDTDDSKSEFRAMSRVGWIDNVGGRGQGAGWVITDKGAEHLMAE
jgi:hypothetical protein